MFILAQSKLSGKAGSDCCTSGLEGCLRQDKLTVLIGNDLNQSLPFIFSILCYVMERALDRYLKSS